MIGVFNCPILQKILLFCHRYMCVEEKVIKGELKEEVHHREVSTWAKKILQGSEYMLWLAFVPTESMDECCSRTYKHKFWKDSAENIFCSPQNSVSWHQHRQFRITGSRCYSLFTASNNKKTDWEKKSQLYFWPKNFESEFTKLGHLGEKLCKPIYEDYCKEKGCTFVGDSGLIVNSLNPWLGYSPDGLVFKDEEIERIVEIKTVKAGKTKHIDEVLPTCKFLNKEKDGYILKRKHQYYGQVTLGMVMTGATKCDFITFCVYDSSMAIEEIDLDPEFARTFISTLKHTFFSKMLHNICLSENNNI